MDAPRLRWAVLAAAIASLGASYRTPNFIVSAPTQDAAEQIGRAAEKYRQELAIEWLGEPMRNWAQPCPITAQVGDQLGAGGATSFVFEHGEVFGWRMTIQGSLVRILDSVLPHEVTHTIFATHFRQPLPRWADEGACTTVEHVSERDKQQNMLIEFLRTKRGIAFSRMFAMKDYPSDVMPLYSQGYSLARYLIGQGGKRKFLEFVGDGLRDENWTRATEAHYGVNSLAALQDSWLDWVKKGSPALDTGQDSTTLVAVKMPGPSSARGRSDTKPAPRRPDPDTSSTQLAAASDRSNARGPSVYELAATGHERLADRSDDSTQQWRSLEASQGASNALAAEQSRPDAHASIPVPLPYQVTRPSGIERPKQVILEWSRPN